MILEELSEKVIRGRWKSFVRKWYGGLSISVGLVVFKGAYANIGEEPWGIS